MNVYDYTKIIMDNSVSLWVCFRLCQLIVLDVQATHWLYLSILSSFLFRADSLWPSVCIPVRQQTGDKVNNQLVKKVIDPDQMFPELLETNTEPRTVNIGLKFIRWPDTLLQWEHIGAPAVLDA